jgi:uncharacterized membrane protein YeaQ/YmgE (transglycosylase-associated protein family)
MMGLWEWLILLLVAGICGGIGQAIAGHTRTGCLGSIAIGFIGALFGTWLARVMDLPELLPLRLGNGATFPIIWSIIGAALFVGVLALFTRRP